MVFKEKFVAVVKVDGKILREHNGIVTIPFGKEYSILLKNLNSVKSVVKISIDGKDVLNGDQIIISPNNSTELEGFLKGKCVSNKFKFIQKTKDIQDFRGDRVDDGIIRIEYKFEKMFTRKETNFFKLNKFNYPNTNIRNSDDFLYRCFSSNLDYSIQPAEDEGITVKGDKSDQKFNIGYIGELDDFSNVIILRLNGYNSTGVMVEETINVDKKIKCETCGKISKSSSKFCNNCGTCLI